MHPQCVRSRCKVKSTPCANDYKHFPVFPTLQTRLWGYGYRHMRSLATKVVRSWISLVGVQTLFITPGGPCENGIIESFNRRLRDECLNVERFFTLEDVREDQAPAAFVAEWVAATTPTDQDAPELLEALT